MKRYIYILFVLCTVSLGMHAKPARRTAIRLTQPDGTQVTAYLHGDAYYHYYTTPEGQMLQRDAKGYYQATRMPSAEELQAWRNSSPRRVAMQKQDGIKLNIAPRGLIILVNFADLTFQTSAAEIDSMINGQHYTRTYSYRTQTGMVRISSSGSARQYFHDTSYGKYNPTFDVMGPVTLSHNYSYYGANNANDEDKNPEAMIKEACQLVDDKIDFSIYDNNGDGYVDFVYVIYAGYGESDGAGDDYIWPHNYNLWTYSRVNCTVDGLKVDSYACSNELDYFSDKHDGIGTFCHEFSHVLGLPDLYSTNNGTHKTMGMWDILDYGPYNNEGNTPPHYSAYERFFMGWLKPTVINQACDIELPAMPKANAAALLTATGTHNLVGNNPSPATFYLLENRQQEGWDKYLPGSGMLITKISFSQSKWEGNTVNNTRYAMGVDLIEADGKTPAYSENNPDNGYAGKAGDAYPAGSDSFAEIEAFQVTDIQEADGVIYFKVNGGGEQILLSAEEIMMPTAERTKKIFRNGQIMIEHNGIYYDLLGNMH